MTRLVLEVVEVRGQLLDALPTYDDFIVWSKPGVHLIELESARRHAVALCRGECVAKTLKLRLARLDFQEAWAASPRAKGLPRCTTASKL